MFLAFLAPSPSASHPRRSRATALGVSLLALGALLVPASVAAHNPSATLECVEGNPWLAINITNYNPQVTNTVGASIDGSSVLGETTFASSYSNSFAAGSPFVSHTAEVVIKAGDDPTGSHGWSVVIDLSVDACQQPTPPPTPIETPPPTGSTQPSASASASASPTGSAEASSSTQVTPPATSTGGPRDGSSTGALFLALALMGLATTGILVLVPNPVNRRRR